MEGQSLTYKQMTGNKILNWIIENQNYDHGKCKWLIKSDDLEKFIKNTFALQEKAK